MNGQFSKTMICLLWVLLAGGACGCHIPNRMYRPAGVPDKAIVEVPPQPPLPTPTGTTWPAKPEAPCDRKNLLERPCLAFLEFDDFGETWERNPSGRPSQLNEILRLIARAKYEDPEGQPVILTFIHGWKHNASGVDDPGGEDPNIVGVESVLNQLHDSYAQAGKKHVVIGIYVAWRGGLIKPAWPVSQQFTYWNREATAIRVGNTSLTDALIEISDAARANLDCEPGDACAASEDCRALKGASQSDTSGQGTGSCNPLLVFIGHSFGALVLERAMSQATVTRMEREWNEENARRAQATKSAVTSAASGQQPGGSGALSNAVSENPIALTPLADLVIYVNSAAAATESKQLIDYLASSGFVYQPPAALCKGDAKTCTSDMPVFLSVTSETDLATGLVLKVGHALPLLGYKLNGSMRVNSAAPGDTRKPTDAYARACFDPSRPIASYTNSPKPNPWRMTDLTETDFYMSTTAHLEPMWSHLLCQLDDKGNAVNDACKAALKSSPSFRPYSIGQTQYEVVAASNRCNGTPYWVIQVQKELIPDHGTIFTQRLIDFLRLFIPEPETVGSHTRPQLTRPQASVQ